MIDQEMIDTMKTLLSPICNELNNITNRLDKMDTRLDKVDIRLDKMDIRLDKIDIRLDKMEQDVAFNKKNLHDLRTYTENEIEPKIRLLAENYVPAAKRYETAVQEMDEIKQDIDVLKRVVADHSEKLKKIS